MNRLLFSIGLLTLIVTAFNVNAESVEGEVKQAVGNEVTSEEIKCDLTVLIKKIARYLEKEADEAKDNIQEEVRRFRDDIKKHSNKFKEGAKKIRSNFQNKFEEFMNKVVLSLDGPVVTTPHTLLAKPSEDFMSNDVNLVEKICGHGHIVDSLGRCREL
ncbi:uncharacterized protein LOC129909712 [Episyrphus balteatus]|uniref:uncharacterized protein LOC129909712 n=1 Tax=Episyrphus balteatus TaxID=286459 RepID=UPI002485D699|nr:uncharacterized protein LOC129909712 [Episyrphus balteatus]